MADDPKHGSFWTTLPGMLTGLAAIITAATGLYLATRQPAPQPRPTPPSTPPSVTVERAASGTIRKAEHFTGPMGPLERGVSYNAGDIYDKIADSPETCVQFCANDDRCRAITFVVSQNRCWVKDRVNAPAASSDMVSARKQP